MKSVNVVEVRDIGSLTPLEAVAETEASEDRVDRMAELLRRYPHIAEDQRQELLSFLTRGRQLEIGLVSAREGVASRLMQFRKDHRREFRLKPLQVAGFVLLILVPLAAFTWFCFG